MLQSTLQLSDAYIIAPVKNSIMKLFVLSFHYTVPKINYVTFHLKWGNTRMNNISIYTAHTTTVQSYLVNIAIFVSF